MGKRGFLFLKPKLNLRLGLGLEFNICIKKKKKKGLEKGNGIIISSFILLFVRN